MDIKSIINKDAVNITNCDSEPIHIPGSIQPHGYLLAVLANTGTITYMSGNTATLFAKSVTVMLDTPLEQHVSAADYSAYLAHIRQTSFDYSKPFVFTISGT